MSHKLSIPAKKDDQVTKIWAVTMALELENPTCDSCGQPIEDILADGVVGVRAKTNSFTIYHIHCAPAKLKRMGMARQRRVNG